jgi:predicted CoA-binding protein
MDDELVREILTTTRRIAVVGASNKPERPSFGVMRFLIGRGFEVVPVNPGLAGTEILGRPVVGSLAEAGELDMVDVFRRSEEVGEVGRGGAVGGADGLDAVGGCERGGGCGRAEGGG